MKDGQLTLQLKLIIVGLRVWDLHNIVLKTIVRTSELFGPRHFSSTRILRVLGVVLAMDWPMKVTGMELKVGGV